VLPGPTASEGLGRIIDGMAAQQNKSEEEIEREFFGRMRPSSLLKRFATTEEVASMVVYLASTPASATNGAALRVDGGVVRAIL
jgi:NAD(P)-dependent dehydrogenase (short-subunit alcohol dehydrogenase family)